MVGFCYVSTPVVEFNDLIAIFTQGELATVLSISTDIYTRVKMVEMYTNLKRYILNLKLEAGFFQLI